MNKNLEKESKIFPHDLTLINVLPFIIKTKTKTKKHKKREVFILIFFKDVSVMLGEVRRKRGDGLELGCCSETRGALEKIDNGASLFVHC